LVEQCGVDGVMTGRGVFKNPCAFEKNPQEHTSKEMLDLLRLQMDLFDKYSRMEPRLCRPQRRSCTIYVNGLRGGSEWRNQLMQTDSTAEVRALLDAFE